jgi:hypothetical protein
MSAPQWKRINDKKYQRLDAAGEWVGIDVPYGKVELIFEEFIGSGGLIDAYGNIATDPRTLLAKFGPVGNILLSTFDEKGLLKEEGNCRCLSPSEIPPLFEIAVDVIKNFMLVTAAMEKNLSDGAVDEK